MKLTRLLCTGFRCLNDVNFTPSSGLNLITGANGQGKTSLLEALLYVATARSHRASQDTELVQYGKQGFRIAAWADRLERPVLVEAAYYNGEKRLRVNGIAQTRVSDILGKINVVGFFAEDVALVRGAASQRRRLFDVELSKVNPEYLRSLQYYRQVIRQRNEVLRHPQAKPEQLDAWDAQLVHHGRILMARRVEFLAQLTPYATRYYEQIAGKGEVVELAYRPDIRADTTLEQVLSATRETDRKQGMTTRGPHRDDIEITLSGKPARQFASQGQQRSVALAIKLATAEWVREMTNEYPILALDDVFSELDSNRARRLLLSMPQHVQCLITVTETKNDTPDHPDLRVFEMRGGCLEEKKQ